MVAPEPNSLWTLLWPDRYGPLDAVDLFHAAHTVLPRRLTMPTVVTIHDLLALEMPRLHRRGWDGVIKRFYYPGAVRRALKTRDPSGHDHLGHGRSGLDTSVPPRGPGPW